MARTENGVHVLNVLTTCAHVARVLKKKRAKRSLSLALSFVLRERKQNDSAAVTRLPRHQLSLEILCTRGYASMQTPLTQFTRYEDFVSDNVSNRGAL